ncbi:MAG: LPS assembly lipoprotein LptE [Zoogloeaceae bacterium]|jgi:LPS-assembly lipoprotein|nr:LPS assembly lipoprotein LptE [Zoogloeaceae bacterium]
MRVWIIVLALLLSACGFHLRGSYALPFDTLSISSPVNAELRALLKRQIEIGTKAKVVDEGAPAQASLRILGDTSEKRILSLSAAGRVSEYQLARALRFRVVDAGDNELLPPSTITLIREMTFDDAAVLSKDTEEVLLWRDIQNDLVQQLLRRLAAIKPKPTSP